MELSYTLAFTTGFLGGFGHCIGMCGPIITTYTLRGISPSPLPYYSRNLLPHLFYNTGRITTYMFIGSIMGLTGSFINTAGGMTGFQNAVALIAGLIMVLMGISISGASRGTAWLERHNSLILRTGKNLLHGETPWLYYPLGALFGFLPCGLSYTVFTAAAGTGGMLSGMLTAFFFGIGTLPALLLFGLIAGYLSHKLRGLLYRLSGIIIMAMGVYFIVRSI
ncbi:MAG: sulfite exporter TauE/SafE family protein [Nitrospiraceae bacterium]|nr:MAG: sulfite exporter TauE/SafE family protein [Nitrospiraceae bacterium]